MNKPEKININDINPVTDWAPNDVNNNLDREIRNLELQRRNNPEINRMIEEEEKIEERDVINNPLKYIDRKKVEMLIKDMKEGHQYREDLAYLWAAGLQKEDFFKEMLGLKDTQDNIAKNATELNKLKNEIHLLNKKINDEKNKIPNISIKKKSNEDNFSKK